MGVAVLAFDYRGYGRSEGSPNEAGVLADARAARMAGRASRLPKAEIVLMGESLGGAVAVDLAAEAPPRGLVLENVFSSLPDVAAYHYPVAAGEGVDSHAARSRPRRSKLSRPAAADPRRRRHDRAAQIRPQAVCGGQRAESNFS